jgi:hypothetical protein
MVLQSASRIDVPERCGLDQHARPQEPNDNSWKDFPEGHPPPFTPSQQEVRSISCIVSVYSLFPFSHIPIIFEFHSLLKRK